jgi:hypothetical protein
MGKRDLYKLLPLREVIQQLWQEELTGVDLLRTFFSRRIQLLRQWV